MTSDGNPPQSPPPPKRRRKPPRGLEGFDTGYPEDADDDTGSVDAPSSSSTESPSGGIPRKQIWSEALPATAPQPTAAPSKRIGGTPSKPIASAIPQPIEGAPSQPMTAAPSQPIAGAITSRGEAAGVVVDPSLSPSSGSIDVGWSTDEPAPSPTDSAPSPSSSSSPSSLPSSLSYAAFDPAAGASAVPTSVGANTGSAPSSYSYASSAELDRVEPLSMAYAGAGGAGADIDLRDAVGGKPAKKSKDRSSKPSKRARSQAPVSDFDDGDGLDDGDGDRPRSRKMIVVSVTSLVVGLGVAALIFLGRSNSSWFYISCESDRIVAQQGRAFPPWGESTLEGKSWAAIKIPPEAECLPLETESEDELSDQFRTMLVKRATVLLTAKEVTKTDEASALLDQALLHARSNTDGARNARVEIQRLLGDVAYWRASLKMRDASRSLVEAAKQFDAAAQQRPRHVTDASAWADYVRKVVGELEAGPAGIPPTTFPPGPPVPPSEQRTPAPPGVALPVEPDRGSASEPAPPAPADAGVATGGVLL